MTEKEKQALWIEFAKVAVQNYETPEDIDNLEDLVNDIADFSASVADAMVEEADERFGGERRRSGRSSRRRRDREEPEPEKD